MGKHKNKSNSVADINSGTLTLLEQVLILVWREQRISRADIARKLGLSRSTVSDIVKDLLTAGLISERGSGESSGGRRPILLEFHDDARIVLGIDIGATHVRATIIDLRGKVLVTEERPFPVRMDPEGTRELVISISEYCLEDIDNGHARLLGIGVALPSPVDPDHPEWLSEVLIPAWRGRTELEELKEHFKVPILIDNDANLGGLAEKLYGAGRGVEDLCYLKFSYGIGAGFILNGDIYRGSGGLAGEIGHLVVDPDGPECVCGLKGCLVTLAGGQAMERHAAESIQGYPRSLLKSRTLEYETILQSALMGDTLATKLIRESALHTGRALSGWINVMNPERVIIGGSMARMGNMLLDVIRAEAERCQLSAGLRPTDIRIAELGEIAESIGAAALALESIFASPGFYQDKLTGAGAVEAVPETADSK